jgi:hypothetical protein
MDVMPATQTAEHAAQATERVDTRVPTELIARARERKPGLSKSGVIRFALAQLCGLPNAEAYGADIPGGPKPRRDTT